MATALQEALELVKSVKVENVNITDLLAQRKVLEQKRNRLFGIEIEAMKVLDKAIADLSTRLSMAERRSRIDDKYLPFSLDALKWRHANGLPKLVLFSLHSATFSIVCTPDKQQKMVTDYYRPYLRYVDHIVTLTTPELPRKLSRCYDDVCDQLRNLAKKTNDSAFSISAKFDGVIPDETRDSIIEAKKHFKEIFIVAEPVGMKIERKLIPARLPRDPIVVGWDGEDLWYVDDFDVTPVEEAALLQPK